ncbi:MAG: carbon storage regulator CsrA [Bacteroidota bacterium]|nr:carbon storage regulator CsrA [Bacteroidota bacterium]
MLILTRKQNEEIRINKDIVIKVLAINDNQIKIGIEAPANIEILRGELYEKIKQTTIEASVKSKEIPKIVNLSVNKIRKISDGQ